MELKEIYHFDKNIVGRCECCKKKYIIRPKDFLKEKPKITMHICGFRHTIWVCPFCGWENQVILDKIW